jgi:hypothetical protein
MKPAVSPAPGCGPLANTTSDAWEKGPSAYGGALQAKRTRNERRRHMLLAHKAINESRRMKPIDVETPPLVRSPAPPPATAPPHKRRRCDLADD